MKSTEFNIEILADGQIKVDMDDMAGPHHHTAEEFLKMVKELLGGDVETKNKKKGFHHHGHYHAEGEQHHHH